MRLRARKEGGEEKPPPTAAELWEAAKTLDVAKEGSPTFLTSVILLASCYIGAYPKTLARHLGISEWSVRKRAVHFRSNGIWGFAGGDSPGLEYGRVAIDFYNLFEESSSDEEKQTAYWSFVLNVLVGDGVVVRSEGKPDALPQQG